MVRIKTIFFAYVMFTSGIVPSALNNQMNRWVFFFLQWFLHESPPLYVNDPIGRWQEILKNTQTVKY